MTDQGEVQPAGSAVEMEINFRLDENGRTAPTTTTTTTAACNNERAAPTLDYHCQARQATLGYRNRNDNDGTTTDNETLLLDELLLDCEIADSGLMPRTFWMPATGTAPRCSLEQLAFEIFHFHVPKDANYYDPTTSGAEWWVQIRPSPSAAGRYTMHAAEDLNDEMSKQGIWFHWDKDEDLRQLMGGDTTYIHPHWSTVTYLTSHGAPTLVLNRRIHPLTGQWLEPNDDNNNDNNEQDQAWISWPKYGKHFSFDGRYLHAAPPDLLPEPFRNLDATTNNNKVAARRQRRVTFLVNIWLNYHPLNVHLFPESMLDKMSGRMLDKRAHMTLGPRTMETNQYNQQQANNDNNAEWKHFEWPMGGCDSGETISLSLPLEKIQKQHKNGGNVIVTWPPNTVILQKTSPHKKRKKEGT